LLLDFPVFPYWGRESAYYLLPGFHSGNREHDTGCEVAEVVCDFRSGGFELVFVETADEMSIDDMAARLCAAGWSEVPNSRQGW
jgi:hypothetical protein